MAATATTTATVAAQISSSLCYYSSARETLASSASKTASSPHLPRKFATGSSLLIQRPVCGNQNQFQSDVSRAMLQMYGLVGWPWLALLRLSIEIATGKGLLENFGVASPLPTVALAVTVLMGVLTAVSIRELTIFARILLFCVRY